MTAAVAMSAALVGLWKCTSPNNLSHDHMYIRFSSDGTGIWHSVKPDDSRRRFRYNIELGPSASANTLAFRNIPLRSDEDPQGGPFEVRGNRLSFKVSSHYSFHQWIAWPTQPLYDCIRVIGK